MVVGQGQGPCWKGGGALTLVLDIHCKTSRTSGAVAVNPVHGRKRGNVTDPSTLRRVAVRGKLRCGGQ